MFRFFQLFLILICFKSQIALGSDSLNYSGRLVNTNGSPVPGPAKLKFDLAYTNDITDILCSDEINGVDLVNGVFHAKINFTCPDTTLMKVLEETPINNSIAIRVTDLTNATPKVYSFQALHSVPFTLMSNMTKQLVQMGAVNGQVLTWLNGQWVPQDSAGAAAISDGSVTGAKLSQMSASVGQVLKWTAGGWAPQDDDDDSGITVENDPKVRAFARNDAIALPNCDPDEKLEYVVAAEAFICSAIVLSDATMRSATVEDAINDAEVAIAPSQNAVFDALADKQPTIDATSDITMKYLKLMTDGAYWVGLKAPALTTGNILFVLPESDGSAGQVLKTDGAGNLGWVSASSGTITEITSTAPLSGTGTSGSVNVSLNYDNTTIGLNGSNALIVKSGGLSNGHIAAAAGIEWSKINKTGASASDIGAVATTTTISPGTGLLGGGDLSANRTLSVNVGTGASQIVQLGADSKLPAVDGSQLTNLLWSQITTASLPVITAGTGLTSTGSLASGQTLNVDVGTAAGKIVQLETGGKLPAVDGSQLTNLGSNLGKWSDGTGGIHYSSGRVGIGTSSPAYNLDILVSETGGINIKDSAATGGRIFLGESTSTTNLFSPSLIGNSVGASRATQIVAETKIAEDTGTVPAMVFASRRDDSSALVNRPLFDWRNASTSLMTMLPSGKLGIGTKTPTQELEVKTAGGSFSATGGGSYIYRGSSTGNGANLNFYTARGTVDVPLIMQNSDQAGYITFRAYDGDEYGASAGIHAIVKSGIANDSTPGELRFLTTSTGNKFSTTRMSIDENGNVGIGTITPAFPFNVVKFGGGVLAEFEGNPIGLNESVAVDVLNSNTTAPPGSNLDMASVNVKTIMPGGFNGQVSIRMLGNNYTGGYGNAGEAVLDASNYSTGLNISNRSSTGPIRFSKSALEYMRITPAGDIGIGTTVPNAKLHVAGTVNFATPYAGAANAKIYTNGAYGQLEILNDTSNNDLAYLSLHSSNNVAWQHGMIGSTYVISQTAGATKTFNDVERLSITNSGNIGIGILAPTQRLDVVGNIKASGCLYYSGTSIGTCASDERLKEEVRPFTIGLDEVLGINPVHFKYNGLGGLPKDDIEQLGVIAQEVEKSAPGLVVKQKVKLHPEDRFETEIKAVDYGAFTYALINATKELYGMVRELFENKEEVSRELASIKAENEAMKSYICQKDPEAPFCKSASDN